MDWDSNRVLNISEIVWSCFAGSHWAMRHLEAGLSGVKVLSSASWMLTMDSLALLELLELVASGCKSSTGWILRREKAAYCIGFSSEIDVFAIRLSLHLELAWHPRSNWLHTLYALRMIFNSRSRLYVVVVQDQVVDRVDLSHDVWLVGNWASTIFRVNRSQIWPIFPTLSSVSTWGDWNLMF